MNNNINQDYFGSGEGGSGNTSGNTVSNTVSGTTRAVRGHHRQELFPSGRRRQSRR